ncbi:hypothetical protein AU476_29340 [Cupriavidus sp. UYMSc13B]|nr:hypothetical protein AU476_29340 [Cupriavidus sp. UYMSc13B]
MDVHLVPIQPEIMNSRHCDHCEGLIDFPQIDIGGRPSGAIQELANGINRRRREPGGLLGMARMTDDPREGAYAHALGDGLAGKHQRRCAVRNRTGVCWRHGAILPESRLQGRNAAQVGLERLLVVPDRHTALAPRDG